MTLGIHSASEMTYIVSSGALNSTHSLTRYTGWAEGGPKSKSLTDLSLNVIKIR